MVATSDKKRKSPYGPVAQSGQGLPVRLDRAPQRGAAFAIKFPRAASCKKDVLVSQGQNMMDAIRDSRLRKAVSDLTLDKLILQEGPARP
jgi:hypothetical protein